MCMLSNDQNIISMRNQDQLVHLENFAIQDARLAHGTVHELMNADYITYFFE
jgi:hypothetical protein